MSDRRLTACNGRVAHLSLKGQVEAERFVEGQLHQVIWTKAPLLRTTKGPRDRELLMGEGFVVLDEGEGGYAYGFAEKDGYCGWIGSNFLSEPVETTHRVNVRESLFREVPDLKAHVRSFQVFHGSRLRVTGIDGDWSNFVLRGADTGREASWWIPSAHICPIEVSADDPVAVARIFLGTPYLWGGNSGRGIDCSGLVQAALLACGIPCPGDSDLQEAMPGTVPDTPAPGDLIFWKGHVAMVSGENAIIHANAHHMAVVEEPMDEAIARIGASDTGPVTSMLRPRGL